MPRPEVKHQQRPRPEPEQTEARSGGLLWQTDSIHVNFIAPQQNRTLTSSRTQHALMLPCQPSGMPVIMASSLPCFARTLADLLVRRTKISIAPVAEVVEGQLGLMKCVVNSEVKAACAIQLLVVSSCCRRSSTGTSMRSSSRRSCRSSSRHSNTRS